MCSNLTLATFFDLFDHVIEIPTSKILSTMTEPLSDSTPLGVALLLVSKFLKIKKQQALHLRVLFTTGTVIVPVWYEARNQGSVKRTMRYQDFEYFRINSELAGVRCLANRTIVK